LGKKTIKERQREAHEEKEGQMEHLEYNYKSKSKLETGKVKEYSRLTASDRCSTHLKPKVNFKPPKER